MGGEVEETVPKTEQDAIRFEVGGGVVAEILGVAEDIAGAGVVIGVPGDEGEDGDEERDDPGKVKAKELSSGVIWDLGSVGKDAR